MPYFDRFDIVEAYYVWLSENHKGQTSREYERLSKLTGYFTPRAMFYGYMSLSDNARAIVDALCVKSGPDYMALVEGPGKYEGEILLTERLDGLDNDDELGDVSEGGHWQLFTSLSAGNIGGNIGDNVAAILHTRTDGFVSGTYYSSEELAQGAWKRLVSLHVIDDTDQLDALEAQGFDASFSSGTGGIRVKCSQCQALVISGTPCHETGCPNIPRETNDDDASED